MGSPLLRQVQASPLSATAMGWREFSLCRNCTDIMCLFLSAIFPWSNGVSKCNFSLWWQGYGQQVTWTVKSHAWSLARLLSSVFWSLSLRLAWNRVFLCEETAAVLAVLLKQVECLVLSFDEVKAGNTDGPFARCVSSIEANGMYSKMGSVGSWVNLNLLTTTIDIYNCFYSIYPQDPC